MKKPNFYEEVYALVRKIPRGSVACYGQLAAMLGSPRQARAVGYALFQLRFDEDRSVPWHRVINASGGISSKGDVVRAELQQKLLEEEGVRFNSQGKVQLKAVRWDGTGQ